MPCCLPPPAVWAKQTRDVLWTSGFSLSIEKTSVKIPKRRYKPQHKAKIRYLTCWRSTSILMSRPMESLARFFVFFAPPMENSRKMWKHWVKMNCWVSLCYGLAQKSDTKWILSTPPLAIFLLLPPVFFLPIFLFLSLVFIHLCKISSPAFLRFFVCGGT